MTAGPDEGAGGGSPAHPQGAAGGNAGEATPRDAKPAPHKRNPLELATVVVLTFTLLAAAFAAYEGSVLSSATNNLVATQRDNAHRELRAYVGLVPGSVESFGDETQRFTILRKNYGRTPAYNVFIQPTLEAVIRPGDPIPTEVINHHKEVGLLTLFPGISLPFYAIGHGEITKEQADSVRQGKDFALVYAGILTYADAFGEEHYTRYCWLFKGERMTENDVEWCPVHNDSN